MNIKCVSKIKSTYLKFAKSVLLNVWMIDGIRNLHEVLNTSYHTYINIV